MIDFFTGSLYDSSLPISNVVRVIIAGNSISKDTQDKDWVMGPKFRQKKTNQGRRILSFSPLAIRVKCQYQLIIYRWKKPFQRLLFLSHFDRIFGCAEGRGRVVAADRDFRGRGLDAGRIRSRRLFMAATTHAFLPFSAQRTIHRLPFAPEPLRQFRRRSTHRRHFRSKCRRHPPVLHH